MLTSNRQLNKKVVYLLSTLSGDFTIDNNVGIVSDNIFDDLGLAYSNCERTSYTTIVETDVQTGTKIRRQKGFLLKGNRISKQIIDNKVYYWYLIINKETIIEKHLIKCT